MADKRPGVFEKILFPTDLTETSEDAAAYALQLARQYRAELHVLHVVDIGKEAAGFYLPHLSYENLDREMVSAAGELLKKYCAIHFKGLKNLSTEVRSGEPYKEILKAAKSGKADVVVMGTFSRGGVDRFLFGSTTERVMRKIDRPVLVVPPSR